MSASGQNILGLHSATQHQLEDRLQHVGVIDFEALRDLSGHSQPPFSLRSQTRVLTQLPGALRSRRLVFSKQDRDRERVRGSPPS